MRFAFIFKPLLIQIGNFVEEFVTVNSQLIDDLLKNRLNLHEGIKTAPALVCHDLLETLDYFDD